MRVSLLKHQITSPMLDSRAWVFPGIEILGLPAKRLQRGCSSRRAIIPYSRQVDQIWQATRGWGEARTRQLRQKGSEASFEGVGFWWGGTRLPSWQCTLLDSLHAPMAVRQERLGHVDATTGYTHLVTADDVRVAGELGALLDEEFSAQDLPRLAPNVKTASELVSEAV
jgi:hypothetical protein